jgi:hypothetical protein
VVSEYLRTYSKNAAAEVDVFKRLRSLPEAIRLACLATYYEDCKPRRFEHQRRIKRIPLLKAYEVLLAREEEVRACQTFEQRYALIHELLKKQLGAGDLYFNDTSLRIGAYLASPGPQVVYLHRGTLAGARNLGLSSKNRVVAFDHLPAERKRLTRAQVEDMLCIFKDQVCRLRAQGAEGKGAEAFHRIRRNWSKPENSLKLCASPWGRGAGIPEGCLALVPAYAAVPP